MYTTYRGIKTSVLPDTTIDYKAESVCQILIENNYLIKLNSPFSSCIDFFYDSKCQLWEIDKTDITQNEIIVKKPKSDIYDQIREYNNLPKLSIHKALQKEILTSMKIV